MSEKLLFPKSQKWLAEHPFRQTLIAGVISGFVVVALQNLTKNSLTFLLGLVLFILIITFEKPCKKVKR